MPKPAILAGFAFLATLLLAPLAIAQSHHPRDFWQAIAQQNYAVPPKESADVLAHELSAMLSSPDPELRDDLAYSILARWIYRNTLSTQTLISLTDEWRENLKSGLGESRTNSVLKRSFSALCLSEMAKREARVPFMGAERFHSLVAEATFYLRAETDLRGYDAALHWIHATAHTADLLAALAGNSLLTKEEASTILESIAARLSTAPEVYTQGEQDRLAAVISALVRRKDFEASIFEPFVNGIEREDRDVWTSTTPESLAHYQNHIYMLQALTVRLLLGEDSPQVTQFRQKVLAVLAKRTD
jgi:hypothetical protein